MDTLQLLEKLVAIPGPVGQEEAVCDFLQKQLQGLDHSPDFKVDPKGNLLVVPDRPSRITVTAHMDEVAMMVKRIHPNGELEVIALGGTRIYKLGEGPVLVLCQEPLTGILGFGSIHTTDPQSNEVQIEENGLEWSMARVFTGLPRQELFERGVRPGTRVVIHPSRRQVLQISDYLASHFLDDRADLTAWLQLLANPKNHRANFIASVAEEVGGEGALYNLAQSQQEICIALELGPVVPDADVKLTPVPTVWVSDSYATTKASDLELVASVGKDIGLDLQFQILSRGGSDASIAASLGYCARPITLGIPMQNTHGFEIIHQDGIDHLVKLTSALIEELN